MMESCRMEVKLSGQQKLSEQGLWSIVLKMMGTF